MNNLSATLTAGWDPLDLKQAELETPRHMFLFYKESNFLLDSLSRFAAGALRGGCRTVVIGMGAHLDILVERLKRQDLDVGRLLRCESYAQIDAKEALAEILLYGMPDERRFREMVEKRVMRRSRYAGEEEQPAIIDEMAGLLWLDGKTEAAHRLLELWQKLEEVHQFSLCCVYPIAAPQKIERPETASVRVAAAGA